MMPACDESALPRPLDYWVARHYPGWISRQSAAEADPIALAGEIERRATEFVDWLGLPEEQRWDTYQLQLLSAALFNRYRRNVRLCEESSSDDVELLDLVWPARSDAITRSLRQIQLLLAPPFAVFKAVRQAALPEELPTAAELKIGESALQACRAALRAHVAELRAALGKSPATEGWNAA